MLKKQRGYTAFELIFVIGFLVMLVGGAFGIYVACHFISKFW